MSDKKSGKKASKKDPKETWKHDEPVGVIDLTDEANDDWFRAARLKKAADAGDKEAQAELERMERTKLKEIK